jgi:hypothetical protein
MCMYTVSEAYPRETANLCVGTVDPASRAGRPRGLGEEISRAFPADCSQGVSQPATPASKLR